MADIDPIVPSNRIDLAGERAFRLGGLEVRPAERLVLADGKRHELQPRVMQVLVALARIRPDVVSRDRLIEQCWSGRIVGDDSLNRCVLALRHLAQEFTPAPFSVETVPRVGHRLVEQNTAHKFRSEAGPRPWRLAAGTASLCVLGAAALLLGASDRWLRRSTPAEHIVSIVAPSGDAFSRELADELIAKLGAMQLGQSGLIRLLGDAEAASHKPDFELQVRRLAVPAVMEARLVLADTSRNAVIWSKELHQPSRNIRDLKQQVAVTAARVLDCVQKASDSPDPLSERTLRLYLGACAHLADRDFNAGETARVLDEVVKAAPRFADGWAKLLMAEADALNLVDTTEAPAIEPQLRRHLVEARRVKPHMAEAYVVEAVLLPRADHVRRGRLLAAGVEHNPDNALVHAEYAMFLQDVGRLNAGVAESRHATRLDPISPAVRDGYITALGVAAATKASRAELREAERLWPGATSLLYSRYRHHLRWGNPREALRLIDSGTVLGLESKLHRPYLEARVDPSPRIVENTVQQARTIFRDYRLAMDGYMQTLAEFDRKEEIFQVLLNSPIGDVEQVIGVLFRPAFSEVHRDPRFMRVANRLGLVKYWQTTGNWPDFCYAADLKYECRLEAAKAAR